mmetsp:Transcript_25245/g.54866  ORF Transcript_25245/g.54866 Transcript_25245/m.54866 type:complete len:494 (-) Transcript_25245:950-2431(-)
MLVRQALPALSGWLKSAGALTMMDMKNTLSTSASTGEFIQLGSKPDDPALVAAPQRAWGAPAQLSPEAVQAMLGGKAARRLAVVREPFASYDVGAPKLSSVVRPLAPGALAVSTSASVPSSRVLVDEYVADASGKFQLSSIANDLLTYLNKHHTRVALLPDLAASSALQSTAVTGASRGVRQSTNEVLMVAPTAFGFNEQAAQDNSFMHAAQKPGEGNSLTRQVLAEYAGLYHQLTEVQGVKVHLFEHSLSHGTPDACFPNNWFSTHQAGEAAGGVKQNTLVLYPMKHPNRAAERRHDIIEVLKQRGYSTTYDMAVEEKNKKYFEGTGVLVIDRINGVVYVDISERADASLAEQWTQRMGYKDLVTFRSTDLRGKSVYHTNVMMAVGTGVAIVCAESVADERERARLLSSLRKTHEVVEISLKQMDHLCGNALELENGKGLPVMAMSTQAYNAFTEEQRRAIRRHVADIVHAPIDTLERVGGGGVRCTLAELF